MALNTTSNNILVISWQSVIFTSLKLTNMMIGIDVPYRIPTFIFIPQEKLLSSLNENKFT